MDWYIKHSDGDSNNIKVFKRCIEDNKSIDSGVRNYGVWSYLEKQMGQYDPGDVDVFIECYDDIYSKICEYISDQDRIKYNKDTNKGRNKEELPSGLKSFLTHFYSIQSSNDEAVQRIKKVFKTEKWEFNFISLNYTNLIQDCVVKMKGKVMAESSFPKEGFDIISIGECLNPHGVLPNVVFGVSDKSQLCNLEYYKNREYKRRMIKKEQAAYYNINDFEKCFAVINNSDIVCLYGCSLGETDNHWWEHIAEWLKANKDHLLIIYYHKHGDFDKKAEENRIRHCFIDLVENGTSIEKRIVITFDEIKFAEIFVDLSASLNISIGSSAAATVTSELCKR